MKLTESPVIFNEIEHSYSFLGNSLSGVTSMLGRTLFSDKYNGIPESVLTKAAEYGSNLHEQIELVDTLGVNSTDENVLSYIRMRDNLGLEHLKSEYLVSDLEYLASSIDIVFKDYSIADIKTTSKLDTRYVSWQLSIYAYLFEMQNEGLTVPKLYAIWLPKRKYGKPMMVEIPRKSKDAIQLLIEWDKSITEK